ncbi:MAG: sulfatase-like hydrolase/transferase [Acidobacteriota bacterium]|nr:sulfatase-like hydrolase/transferase [Acidobacteriota bacterium]
MTIDTLRADALGFAGNAAATTPHLDGLAAGGWVFERAHAHSVMTLPSHANLLTGRLPYEHGVRDNAGFVLPDSVPTAAEAFAAAGFRAAAFVAAFPLDARYGLDRGFEVYDDSYPEGSSRGMAVAERSGDEVVAAAVSWWRRHEGERRFLWVHLYEPHVPYEPPPPFAARFPDRPYLGEVAAADAHVGRLHEVVAQSDGGAEVLFVVTSDHGEGLGDHGEETHGLFAYEATLAVPLLFWAEALTAARIDSPVGHVDVLPTMLEAAAVEAPTLTGTAGHSLWRDPGGGSAGSAARRATYFEALHSNLQRGWAPLRGVVGRTPAKEGAGSGSPGRLLKYVSLPRPELYDLDADPAEARNLHAAEREAATALAELLPAESEWPPAAGAVSEEERRALQSLGYLSSSGGVSLPRAYGEEDDPKSLVDVDRMIQDYSVAYQAGRLEEAEALARRMIERRPGMGLGYANLAQVLLDQGRIEEALRLMIDAERRSLASPFLERQLALTLAQVGRAQDAVRLMERHVRSTDPDALDVLGLVLAEAGQSARAREVLSRSLEIDERNPRARQNLALAALHEADWPLCEREARAALALNPALPLSWNYLGIALFNQRRTDEAIQAWLRSVALDPGDLDVLFNLANVAARSGRADIARPALERYVKEASVPSLGDRHAAELAVARSLLRGL